MNNSLRTLFLAVGCACLLCAGCINQDNGNNDRTAILHQPPYAALTDSLRQANGPAAAGLYFRRAEQLSRNDKHELAADDYSRSWQLNPDETTGFRYASTLSIIGQTNNAIRVLKDCRDRYPANPIFPSMLAEILQQSGKDQEALGIYDAMLSKDSLDNETWYEKGLLLEKIRDTVPAIAALHRAYTLQPVNTYGLELAHLYAENRNPAALPICDEVLRKDSAHALLDPLFIKGIYYSNIAQYKKAIVEFDSCIGRDWKFTDAYLEKGIALYKQKQYDSALSTFQMTIRVSNTYADGYYWAGRCYEATGRNDRAVLYYRQALALDKDFSEAAERIRRLQ